MRGFWTLLAIIFTLAVIGLSMAMNFAFGYGLGTSPANARILGALSVACDGLKAMLPVLIAWQWSDGRRLAAAAGLLLFGLLLAYGTASAIGFAAENRASIIGSRDGRSATLDEALADQALARRRLAELPAHRLSGVVEADIAARQKDRIWDATRGCLQPTLAGSRAYCKEIEQLRGELALGREHAALSAKIERIGAEIRQGRQAGAAGVADPQAAAITDFTGFDAASVRSGLTWLLAITVEAISAFGLFAITRRVRRMAPTAQHGPMRKVLRRFRKTTTREPATGWRLLKAG
jgi:hypothetical protein